MNFSSCPPAFVSKEVNEIMGNYYSGAKPDNFYSGDPRILSYPFLDMIQSDNSNEIYEKLCSEQSAVIVIKLRRLQALSQDYITGILRPYIEVLLVPPDPVAGEQKQYSSYKPHKSKGTSNWDPTERFQFVTTNKESSKIRVTLKLYRSKYKSIDVGVNHIHLSQTNLLLSTPTRKARRSSFSLTNAISMISPKSGLESAQVEFETHCISFRESLHVQEQYVWEYQRWKRITGWVTGRVCRKDPGRYCYVHYDGSAPRWAEQIDEPGIMPELPPGWSVTENWHFIATLTDPDGFIYSSSFDSKDWFPTEFDQKRRLCVRRRKWQREIVDGPLTPSAASSVSPSVRITQSTTCTDTIDPEDVTDSPPSPFYLVPVPPYKPISPASNYSLLPPQSPLPSPTRRRSKRAQSLSSGSNTNCEVGDPGLPVSALVTESASTPCQSQIAITSPVRRTFRSNTTRT